MVKVEVGGFSRVSGEGGGIDLRGVGWVVSLGSRFG